MGVGVTQMCSPGTPQAPLTQDRALPGPQPLEEPPLLRAQLLQPGHLPPELQEHLLHVHRAGQGITW